MASTSAPKMLTEAQIQADSAMVREIKVAASQSSAPMSADAFTALLQQWASKARNAS